MPETALSVGGLGVGSRTHREPFQRSDNASWVLPSTVVVPTAMHESAEGHDNAFRFITAAPGFPVTCAGVGWTAQRAPFQCSARTSWMVIRFGVKLNDPTAVHERGEAQSTPRSEPP